MTISNARIRASVAAAFIGAVLTMAGLGACAKTEVVRYETDYPSYSSVQEIFGKANLVVKARIAETTEVREIELSPIDKVSMVYTIYQAQIEKVYKGTSTTKVVEVKIAGGKLGNVEYVSNSAISLTPGGTYVLFLETYPDAPASLLNPAQSQYKVDKGGRLTPVGDNKLPVPAVADLDRLSTSGATN